MKKLTRLCTCLILIVGCVSQPIPAWLDKGFDDLERYKSFALIGDDRKASLYFQNVLEEISKSGDLDILAKVYLTRCAVETALLLPARDEEYVKIAAVQSSAGTKAYHDFLTGPSHSLDPSGLPDPYRKVIEVARQGTLSEMNHVVAGIDDPLSRLIAAGWLVRQGKYDEGLLNTAIETASSRGWKRALLVYLERLQSLYESRMDTEQADLLRKRMEILRR
ncbi:MAG: hypothetical protein JW950_09065 [Deltaproteobacteria bacterium]|nr:hypothetical protein [Deltaproteobacteria bacterium]